MKVELKQEQIDLVSDFARQLKDERSENALEVYERVCGLVDSITLTGKEEEGEIVKLLIIQLLPEGALNKLRLMALLKATEKEW